MVALRNNDGHELIRVHDAKRMETIASLSGMGQMRLMIGDGAWAVALSSWDTPRAIHLQYGWCVKLNPIVEGSQASTATVRHHVITNPLTERLRGKSPRYTKLQALLYDLSGAR